MSACCGRVEFCESEAELRPLKKTDSKEGERMMHSSADEIRCQSLGTKLPALHKKMRPEHCSESRGFCGLLRKLFQVVASVALTTLSPVLIGDDRLELVMVISEPEYETHRTLPEFAERYLSDQFRVSLVTQDPGDENGLINLDAISDADLMLISVRRRTLPPEQLQRIRDYVSSGRPVLGVRTASHAFHLRGRKAPEGRSDWPSFDQEVIGGSYTNHRGAGPAVAVVPASEGAALHPILKSVDVTRLSGFGSLYQVLPLQTGAVPLLIGSIPDYPSEPVAWTFQRADGGMTFYTSLGHPKDFSQMEFCQLLQNAAQWLVRKEIARNTQESDLD
jgi:type 1 glutamine amidotransferase